MILTQILINQVMEILSNVSKIIIKNIRQIKELNKAFQIQILLHL